LSVHPKGVTSNCLGARKIEASSWSPDGWRVCHPASWSRITASRSSSAMRA
jgi:hypothetical protein